MPTKQELFEFRMFCENATDQQQLNILEKETKANRAEYARVARQAVEMRMWKGGRRPSHDEG